MSTLRQTVERAVRKVLGLSNRPYKVKATISFDFVSPKELDFNSLRRAIIEVDRIWPWKDSGGADSMIGLSDGEVSPNKLVYWFTFRPGVSWLTKCQIYAYEKYVAKLAEELASRCYCNPDAVRCQVNISRSYEFGIKAL